LDQTAAWQPWVLAQSAQQVVTVPPPAGDVTLSPLMSQCERVLHKSGVISAVTSVAAAAAGSNSSRRKRSGAAIDGHE